MIKSLVILYKGGSNITILQVKEDDKVEEYKIKFDPRCPSWFPPLRDELADIISDLRDQDELRKERAARKENGNND